MNKGFTLIEFCIIMMTIGLIAAIAIPSFVRAKQKADAEKGLLENPIAKPAPTSAYKVVVIGECEYIESENRTYGLMTSYTLCHKGDCTNSLHWQHSR